MEQFDSHAIPPTGVRAGGRGRRNVSPIWWFSDDSSFFISGLGERPNGELLVQDENLHEISQREQSVQMQVPNPPVLAARPEHQVLSFANPLRRQPAAICLSAQYLESGKCSTRESHKTGAVEQQTICSTVATQSSPNGTNNRSSRHYLLSADMNQPEVVKISPGSRRVSAQTAATALNAGVSEDIVDWTGQQNGHKANDIRCSSTEDVCTRSSIVSETTTSIKGTGNVTANIDPVQHFEAPKLSPQQAEFLNVQSSRVRHESLLLPSRRDLSTPHNRIEEQHKPSHIKSIMAKFDSKVKARVQEKRKIWRQPVLRDGTDARQALSDLGDKPAKIQSLPQWGVPLDPKEGLHEFDNILSHRATIPAHLGQQDNGTNRGRPFDQRSAIVPGSPRDQQYRGHFMLGQAQAVRMTKSPKAKLVGVSPKKSRSFDTNSLSSVEADLMASAGAVARSSRRSSVRTDGAQSSEASSPDIEAATDDVFPMSRQQSIILWAVPGAEENTARVSEQPLGEESENSGQDVRFRQLAQRLQTHNPESRRDIYVERKSQKNFRQESATEEESEIIAVQDIGILRRKPCPPHQQILVYCNLDNRTKRKPPVDDVSRHTSPSKVPADPNSQSGNSGCPSLISDDGREPSDFPDDMADNHAQTSISQSPAGILVWGKEEDASSVPNGTPSESSVTLVDISVDENELPSRADTSEDQPDENASSCSGHGWWYREPRAVASPLSFRHGNLPSRLRERCRDGRGTSGRQPNELTLYAQCAILRWLISTTDAPGTPGMWHESSVWWELLELADEYQLRYDDDVRAEMLRVLRFLSDPEEPLPEPSQEVQAFLREISPPSEP